MRTRKILGSNVRCCFCVLVILILFHAAGPVAWPQELSSGASMRHRTLLWGSSAAPLYFDSIFSREGEGLGRLVGESSLFEGAWTTGSSSAGPRIGNAGDGSLIATEQVDLIGSGCAYRNSAGQTATLLPDGSLLLLGGLGLSGPVSSAFTEAPGSTQATQLPSDLIVPRAWHTSTLLPDGSVLVFGGADSSGNVIGKAEAFDPSTRTFTLLTIPVPMPRAYHSATLLTDGTVLVAGGLSPGGSFLPTAELWDPATGNRTPLPGQLNVPRRNHCAELLSDGRVLLWGGTDASGQQLNNGEVYDPTAQTFSVVQTIPAETPPGVAPALMASRPQNGAQDVPLLGSIAMRFSEPLSVRSVDSSTVSLNGPQGKVSIKVVPAEWGKLAFVTYSQPLLPGTTYSLLLDGLTDVGNRALPATQMVFTTTSPATVPEGGIGTSASSNGVPGEQGSLNQLPPLQAAPGVTAIAGQVFKLNGRPLANVTIFLDGTTDQTRTDSTGRFLLLLPSLASGHQQIVIDGKTASASTVTYGLFEYGMDVKPGITNVLPFIIWMPALDTAHAVNIPVPTKEETVVTTPLLPGLQLRIPSGTVIYDYYGKIVHQITITPVPVNKPPFPLPNVAVPIYFTIQPGGAWLAKISASGPQGAQLYYPNTYHKKVGTVFQFWNYNPDGQGWYIYGLGRVAPGTLASGSQEIVPDPGVLIYGFSGAMVGDAGAPPNGPAPGNTCCPVPGGTCKGLPPCSDGDSVDIGTGLFVYTHTDLALQAFIPINLTRTYRPNDPTSRAFGIGTTHPYDIFLISPDQDSHIYLILPDGGRIGCVAAGSNWQCKSSPTSFFGATITEEPTTWVVTKKDGTVLTFPGSFNANTAQQEAIIGWQDRNGNTLTFTRDSNSNLTKIASSNGRYFQFSVDSSGRITQATDNIGRVVQYAYDANGRLSTVTDAKGGITTYSYDGKSSNMTNITDPRGITYLTNQYDSNNRIIQQTRIDNSQFTFFYTLDNNNNVIASQVTDPRGNIRQATFNSNGYTLTDARAVGTPQQEATTYNRDPSTNLVNSATDALSRTTSYTYDALGNVLSITQLYGTQGAVTTSFTYNQAFSEITSITDPLNRVTTLGYDSVGDLVTWTDPLQDQWTFAYNPSGQAVSATDPLSNSTYFTYVNGNLSSFTDALLRTTTLSRDGAGRLVSLLDPLGVTTQYQYDPLDGLTRITDALGGITSFTYDPDDNLLTVTDALNHMTSYGYDNLDRLSIRTDPLQHSENYSYDLDGNLATFTDRKRQTTAFAYDSLNRLASATYADNSSISYTYDLGNRLTQTLDSSSGTISRTYDGLDRLTQESTPQGSVAYTYDSASRRTTMTMANQPAVSYTYDNADRLTQITQASSNVVLSYDAASRRTALQLPNGVTENYTYDAASEPIGITYKLGMATLGNLTYIYDADGRRTSMGGTYARTGSGIPPVTAQRIYNADNQLVQLGNTTLTYDADGNLTNDGANTYTWNPRNQLALINAGITGSFQYDAFGRRSAKTIIGTSTGFLYDGLNPVQELSGGIASANLLTGLAIDEIFSRTDSAGSRHFLTDALGSTLALTDSSGSLQTQYTYEPFGNAISSGQSSSNSYEYTARENDNIGLYYYRARFYSPTTERFISEDPVGFAGGINLSAYAQNDPLTFRDPHGTQVLLFVVPEVEVQPVVQPVEKQCSCEDQWIRLNYGNFIARWYSWFSLASLHGAATALPSWLVKGTKGPPWLIDLSLEVEGLATAIDVAAQLHCRQPHAPPLAVPAYREFEYFGGRWALCSRDSLSGQVACSPAPGGSLAF